MAITLRKQTEGRPAVRKSRAKSACGHVAYLEVTPWANSLAKHKTLHKTREKLQ
jgi:hypothetical protein